jgi:hypothetical protein
VPRLEEMVYQPGRDALANQDAVVTGIRQRTGTVARTWPRAREYVRSRDGCVKVASLADRGRALRSRWRTRPQPSAMIDASHQ